METKASQHTIELRSEKTRQIIGCIPPVLLRYGIVIITVVVCFLFIMAYFVPYQENITGNATIENINNSSYEMSIMLPYDKISQIKEGIPVQVEVEGYNFRQYGYLNGSISKIDKNVISLSGKNYFRAKAIIPIGARNIEIHQHMKGDAFILISQGSLLFNLFRRNSNGK